MNEIIDWVLQTLGSIDPLWRTLIAGFAIMLETSVLLGLVIPGDTVVIVAALAVEDAAQWAGLIVATVIGALCGESIGYGIGRWLGPRLLPWLDHRVPRAAHAVRRATGYLQRRGGPAVALSRFLPVLHSLVPLVAGISGFGFRRFLAWTAPVCVIWSIGYASVGWLAGGTYRELSQQLHWAGYLFVGIVAVFLVVVWLVKRRIARAEDEYLDRSDADATAATPHGDQPQRS